jgi:very-short-patch-repair endonuclease
MPHRFRTVRNRTYPQVKAAAKRMREHPTPSERLLWERINRKKTGFKVRRQAWLLGTILDFYIPYLKLAIELDGRVHKSLRQQAKDTIRDARLFKQDRLVVWRFSADSVEYDPDEFAIRLTRKLLQRARELQLKIPYPVKILSTPLDPEAYSEDYQYVRSMWDCMLALGETRLPLHTSRKYFQFHKQRVRRPQRFKSGRWKPDPHWSCTSLRPKDLPPLQPATIMHPPIRPQFSQPLASQPAKRWEAELLGFEGGGM